MNKYKYKYIYLYIYKYIYINTYKHYITLHYTTLHYITLHTCIHNIGHGLKHISDQRYVTMPVDWHSLKIWGGQIWLAHLRDHRGRQRAKHGLSRTLRAKHGLSRTFRLTTRQQLTFMEYVVLFI